VHDSDRVRKAERFEIVAEDCAATSFQNLRQRTADLADTDNQSFLFSHYSSSTKLP
jgi:hypothetical protein